ncbi:RagB/SusD family nutrient uptake outer membrane protein [Mucilaginibacter sp. Mucisp86]|uniref:RagB/SusD family nutrient uptake outer membrane protein n=1 Tax=Mucilaginibacter sp. Mucisp86 TaxID=3243060 RepID=UPI0039B5D284
MKTLIKLTAVRVCLILFPPIMAFYDGCKKQDELLNARPDAALNVPSTLADVQSLLANEDIFNRNYATLGELATDDYYVTDGFYANMSSTEQNAYLWAKSLYPAGAYVDAWSVPYQAIYYANQVQQILATVPRKASDEAAFNQAKGSALFFRAMAYFDLVQTFALPYDAATAASEPGVPLRPGTDLTAKAPRASQQACYAQVLSDLDQALQLLQPATSSPTQPNKAAAYGMTARVNLCIGRYDEALKNATASLAVYNKLQDFNALDPSAYPVFPNYSPEELFHASLSGYYNLYSYADTTLLRSFDGPNDLRKAIFFYKDGDGLYEFNSQYGKHGSVTTGISTAEMYLTKAECEARAGSTAQALSDLNTLLVTRWKKGTFVPYSAKNAADALTLILQERRKELVMTGVRWYDLRRLNQEAARAVTLIRDLNGEQYSLPPKDPRYAMPIPDTEIQLNPIPQNQR